MAECIERGAAIRAIYEATNNPLYRLLGSTLADTIAADACKKIQAIPAANVVPVRHGRWIDKGKSPYNDMFKAFECSECGMKYQDITVPGYYCPNCGARMDGGEGSGKE